ncbi:MAG: hypothetical protein ABIO72_00390 [Patescibacteria group bacterium]
MFATNASALLIVYLLRSMTVPSNAIYRIGWEYVVLAIFTGALITALIRRRDVRITWEVVCAVAAVAGVWYVPALILPMWGAILLSALVTIVGLFWRPFANVFAFLGAVGMAFALGMWLPIEVLLVGLAVLVTYDMVAGSHGHSVQMLLERVGSNAFLPHFDVGTAVGVAEVALPCAVVLAVVQFGFMPAVIVAIGGVVGAIVATLRTPRDLCAEYVAIGTILPTIAVLLSRVFL